MGSLSLLKAIFPTQGSNPGLLHCRWSLYQPNHRGSPLRGGGCVESNGEKHMAGRTWGFGGGQRTPLTLLAGGRRVKTEESVDRARDIP